MRLSAPFFALLTALLLTGAPVLAQNAPNNGQANDGRAFSAPAFALGSVLLGTDNMTISLWGVEPAYPGDSADAMRARAHLDDLIGSRPVRCLAMRGAPSSGNVQARCLNGQDLDLGLMMVTAGHAAVDRRGVAGSDLATAYVAAEQKARVQGAGVWGGDAPADTTEEDMRALTGGVPIWAIAGALLIVPLLGFLTIAIIMQMGFRQLITLQKYQIAGTQKRERQLKEREKYVIASALEGELMTNRAKLDAFLVIYEELLKSLRDPAKTPKYQRAGDIIHEKPALVRTVYDSHIDKMELLGPQLASELSNLYNMIVPNPDYRTLEPEVPIEKAREQVDRIVRNAERLIEPMDKVGGALAIIVRDKRGAVAAME